MRRVNIGIIGYGGIAQWMHLPFLKELSERFQIVAASDYSPTLRNMLGEEYRVEQRYPDYRDLLADESVEAVINLTGPAAHAELCVAAAEAGKHVFVEKPMCISVAEADRIVAAVERSGVKLMVGYMKRYDPGYLVGLEEIKKMDAVRLIRLHGVINPGGGFMPDFFTRFRPDDLPPETMNAYMARQEAAITEAIGDAPAYVRHAYWRMLQITSHDMSILTGAFGPPKRVLSSLIWDGGDYYTATLDYGDDLVCVFEAGITDVRRFDEELAAFGPQRVVKIQFPSPFLKYAPTMVVVDEMAGTQFVQKSVLASYEEAFKRELVAFHECIVTDSEPWTSAEEARGHTAMLTEMVNVYMETRV